VEGPVVRTFYGDPNDAVEDLLSEGIGPPQIGDELCEGHQMHYEWNGRDWGRGPLKSKP
jgi:hypothetical protein